MKEEQTFPSWHYGPNGEARIFNAAADVPDGWSDRQPPAAAEPKAVQDHAGTVTEQPVDGLAPAEPKKRGRPAKPLDL